MKARQTKAKELNLTEVFLQKNKPEEDSFLWSASKTMGTGLLYGGAALLLVGIALIGGALPGGAIGASSYDDDKKSEEPDMVIHKPLKLSPAQVVMAEPVNVKSAFGKAGAQTMIYADTGEKHYITQPIQYLQKLGCAVG